jgi:hypothetical protein
MSTESPSIPRPRPPTVRSILAVVILGLIAACVVLAQTSAGRSLLRRTHISQPAEGYVQLYFRSPGTLPDYAAARRARQRVAFVLVNDDQHTRTLRWTIGMRGRPTAAHGSLRLAPGRRRTVRRTVLVRCVARRVLETVRLAVPRQSIGYWLTCPRPPIRHPRP